MKKIFTLLLALCAVIGVNAQSNLTFAVQANDDFTISVTPSNSEDTYVAVAIDGNYWAYLSMFGYTSIPEILFQIVNNLDGNLYTGATTLSKDITSEDLVAGTYRVVVAGAVMGEEGELVNTTLVNVETVTLENELNPDDPEETSDLTFEFVNNGTSFTLIPSDEEQSYYLWVFSEGEIEMLEEYGMSMEEAFLLYAEYADEYSVLVGATTQDALKDWYLGDDYGTYYVCAVAVNSYYDEDYEMNMYKVVGETQSFVWEYSLDNPTAIKTLASDAKVAKAIRDGRIILNGRYNLNGTLAK